MASNSDYLDEYASEEEVKAITRQIEAEQSRIKIVVRSIYISVTGKAWLITINYYNCDIENTLMTNVVKYHTLPHVKRGNNFGMYTRLNDDKIVINELATAIVKEPHPKNDKVEIRSPAIICDLENDLTEADLTKITGISKENSEGYLITGSQLGSDFVRDCILLPPNSYPEIITVDFNQSSPVAKVLKCDIGYAYASLFWFDKLGYKAGMYIGSIKRPRPNKMATTILQKGRPDRVVGPALIVDDDKNLTLHDVETMCKS